MTCEGEKEDLLRAPQAFADSHIALHNASSAAMRGASRVRAAKGRVPLYLPAAIPAECSASDRKGNQ